MAPFTKKQGSISTTSFIFEPIPIFEITDNSFGRQSEFEHNKHGVHSTIRIDSYEQDGNISIEMLLN